MKKVIMGTYFLAQCVSVYSHENMLWGSLDLTRSWIKFLKTNPIDGKSSQKAESSDKSGPIPEQNKKSCKAKKTVAQNSKQPKKNYKKNSIKKHIDYSRLSLTY